LAPFDETLIREHGIFLEAHHPLFARMFCGGPDERYVDVFRQSCAPPVTVPGFTAPAMAAGAH
jgi:hypothetical protein